MDSEPITYETIAEKLFTAKISMESFIKALDKCFGEIIET